VLLIVNYHYIGDTEFPFPGIHPLSPQVFRRQLEALADSFEFVGEADLLSAVAGETDLPEKACLLTFDDGLREQYTQAVPILDEFRVSAIFFVPGLPFDQDRPLTVHKIHWLRSQMRGAVFHECLSAVCRELGLMERVQVAQKDTGGKYYWDDSETRKAKYLLNVLLSERERAQVVDAMESRVDLDGHDYFEQLYLTREQLKELDDRFAVGTHGYSHCALASMNKSGIGHDISRSLAVLFRMGCHPKTISYPYGYEGAVSPIVFDVARAHDMRAGFTTERSFNTTLTEPLALARIDTNDAPGGKQPIVVPDNGRFRLSGVMTMGRTRYCQE
jgi:peptidoglycan/xylan/chitin deacetylase (PgdA/CDA1 family)